METIPNLNKPESSLELNEQLEIRGLQSHRDSLVRRLRQMMFAGVAISGMALQSCENAEKDQVKEDFIDNKEQHESDNISLNEYEGIKEIFPDIINGLIDVKNKGLNRYFDGTPRFVSGEIKKDNDDMPYKARFEFHDSRSRLYVKAIIQIENGSILEVVKSIDILSDLEDPRIDIYVEEWTLYEHDESNKDYYIIQNLSNWAGEPLFKEIEGNNKVRSLSQKPTVRPERFIGFGDNSEEFFKNIIDTYNKTNPDKKDDELFYEINPNKLSLEDLKKELISEIDRIKVRQAYLEENFVVENVDYQLPEPRKKYDEKIIIEYGSLSDDLSTKETWLDRINKCLSFESSEEK